jgi:holo-[acyl-carrier protein] synthase
MIYGIGVDIVEVAKVASSIHDYGDTYLSRMFTPKEIRYCNETAKPIQRYAARIAAKEAAMKALSTGWDAGVQWHHFEILNEESGQPVLLVHGAAKRLLTELVISKYWVSLSHVPDYAIAQVIFEK